eukprot:13851588-Ditylum_brightwellii.AAC.1
MANQQATWGLSGVKGWYIGPTLEHYQCYKVYIPSTMGECIVVSVDFHLQSSKLPHISAAEVATHAVKDLSAALTGPNTHAPFAVLGDDQLQVICQLASIFQKARQTGKDVPSPRVMGKSVQSATIKENTLLLR